MQNVFEALGVGVLGIGMLDAIMQPAAVACAGHEGAPLQAVQQDLDAESDFDSDSGEDEVSPFVSHCASAGA